MFLKKLGLLGLVAGLAVTTAACTDGYGYSGVSVGYGSGGYVDDGYGYYDSGYYGGNYYGGYGGYGGYGYAPVGYGWYNGYYYPGSGYYVYDRYRRPYRWNDGQRRYWEGRRGYGWRDGRPNWDGYQPQRPGLSNGGNGWRDPQVSPGRRSVSGAIADGVRRGQGRDPQFAPRRPSFNGAIANGVARGQGFRGAAPRSGRVPSRRSVR